MDSMNVKHWIQGQSRENKPFIANCVGKIYEFSAHSQWLYIPLNVNLADLADLALLTIDSKTPPKCVEGGGFHFQLMGHLTSCGRLRFGVDIIG